MKSNTTSAGKPKMSVAEFNRRAEDARMKARIATMKSSIDTSPPATVFLSHIQSNAKREADLRAKRERIERENVRLMTNLRAIYLDPDPLHIRSSSTRALPSLNLVARKREAERIASDNAFLMKRILKSASHGTLPSDVVPHKQRKESPNRSLTTNAGSSIVAEESELKAAPTNEHVNAPAAAVSSADTTESDCKPADTTVNEPNTIPAVVSSGPRSNKTRHGKKLKPLPTVPSAATLAKESLKVYQRSTLHDLSVVYSRFEKQYSRVPIPSSALADGTLQLLNDTKFIETGALNEQSMHKQDGEIIAALAGSIHAKSKPSDVATGAPPGHIPPGSRVFRPKTADVRPGTMNKRATQTRGAGLGDLEADPPNEGAETDVNVKQSSLSTVSETPADVNTSRTEMKHPSVASTIDVHNQQQGEVDGSRATSPMPLTNAEARTITTAAATTPITTAAATTPIATAASTTTSTVLPSSNALVSPDARITSADTTNSSAARSSSPPHKHGKPTIEPLLQQSATTKTGSPRPGLDVAISSARKGGLSPLSSRTTKSPLPSTRKPAGNEGVVSPKTSARVDGVKPASNEVVVSPKTSAGFDDVKTAPPMAETNTSTTTSSSSAPPLSHDQINAAQSPLVNGTADVLQETAVAGSAPQTTES